MSFSLLSASNATKNKINSNKLKNLFAYLLAIESLNKLKCVALVVIISYFGRMTMRLCVFFFSRLVAS